MGRIVVSNLGKAYKKYPTRWSRFLEWITPGGRNYHELKRVLQDINFTIQPGEAVGIIGVNGAGKSTLLKLITGTTQPTTGSVQMTGRVAAMLELGMGFHPDFTGRQNVYMSGQLLGMASDDISKLMPEIEAFAEIGEYIDMPVRVYSSGMQMRLAFSVATAIRPDILIVDEALSVGDTYFQHKSFERIRNFRELGTTLLIVSHDKQAIQSICDRAILIDGGQVLLQGIPADVMDYYNALISIKKSSISSLSSLEVIDNQTLSGNGELDLKDLALLNARGVVTEAVVTGEKCTIRVIVKANTNLQKLVCGLLIKDRLGQTVFGTNTYHHGLTLDSIKQNEKIVFSFSFHMNLGNGSYSLSIGLHESDTHLTKNYLWIDRALVFTVSNTKYPYFDGVSLLTPEVEFERFL